MKRLSQRLDFTSLNNHFGLKNLSIYYMWKYNKTVQKKLNKIISVPTSNDGFELPISSYLVSDI